MFSPSAATCGPGWPSSRTHAATKPSFVVMDSQSPIYEKSNGTGSRLDWNSAMVKLL